MKGINPPTNDYAWPTLDMNASGIVKFTELTDHVRYMLGAKSPLARALRDIEFADCSDWVRRAIWQLAQVEIPQGSWNQGEWAKQQGFKVSNMASCKLKDGALRLVVRKQKVGSKSVTRHVWLCWYGKAYHCSSSGGGVAVTRLLPATGRESVYVLVPPQK